MLARQIMCRGVLSDPSTTETGRAEAAGAAAISGVIRGMGGAFQVPRRADEGADPALMAEGHCGGAPPASERGTAHFALFQMFNTARPPAPFIPAGEKVMSA